MGSVVIRLPDRAWAECAKADLESEGLRVRLAGAADCDGLWAMDISGCVEKIRAIHLALQPAPPPYDWAACVNSLCR